METITLEDGTLETILLDAEDYLWAMEWVIKSPRLEHPMNEMVVRLGKAIEQYARVGLMLDAILGHWREPY